MATSLELRAARRNAVVFGASVVTAGLLLLYPTSTNHGGATRKPGTPVAPAGVVTPAPSTTAESAALTVNGSAVDTRYGLVQVQLVVKSGRIVKAIAIDYPQANGRDRQINAYAIPELQAETLAAQSANIDTISGATYTSEGYLKSLQSALDAAHLGAGPNT